MSTIDQLAEERDKLKAKLSQANAKLKQAKLRADALAVERDRALQTVERANTANLRARAMICDAAGIPHDADILEWISGAKERIERLIKAGDALRLDAGCQQSGCQHDDAGGCPCVKDIVAAWDAAKEAQP